MRIGIVTSTFLPTVGGAEMTVHHLARQFQVKGHDTVVFAPLGISDLIYRRDLTAENAIYPIERYLSLAGLKRIIPLRAIELVIEAKIRRLYREKGFDVLLGVCGWPSGYATVSFGRRWGLPVVVRPIGDDFQKGAAIGYGMILNRRMAKRIQLAFREADRLIAAGLYIKQTMMHEFGVDARRIEVVNNGVDLSQYDLFGVYQHPKPYILSLSRLVPKKGVDVLIRAFAELKAHLQNWDLIVTGDGPERKSLEHLARELGIEGRTVFVGTVTGPLKVALYKGCRFFVSASRFEPWGHTLLEAMAAKKAVLASNVDGHPEIVQDGENGFLFESENADDLAEHMEQLVQDEGFCDQMGKEGYKFALEHDWAAIAAKYIGIFEDLRRQE